MKLEILMNPKILMIHVIQTDNDIPSDQLKVMNIDRPGPKVPLNPEVMSNPKVLMNLEVQTDHGFSVDKKSESSRESYRPRNLDH